MLNAILVVLLGACSTSAGPPNPTTVSKTAAEPEARAADVGVRFDRVGDLGECDPTGRWRAVGIWRGVGNCGADLDPVTLEIEVVRGSAGYRLVPPAGANGRGDSLAAAAGACALSLELHYQLEARDRPNIILFADLVEGGKSSATWDEYEPTAAGVAFRPDQGTIRCSDALDVTIERVASAAAPKVRNEDHQ